MDTKKIRLIQKIKRELGSVVVDALNDPSVIEIILNPDKKLWIERLGEPMKLAGELDSIQAESALKTIASYMDEVLTKDNPIISCELPIDGSRFQGMISPVVPNPAFSIRKKAISVFSLDEYVKNKIMTPKQKKRIELGIKNHENIVIVGSTGSGKTTLANGIIMEMVNQYPNERLLIIEDTNEIQCTAQNSVTMRSNTKTSQLLLLRSCMRLRPDRILVGEVRGKEAWTLLKAWNTGHPGGLVTVHANDAHSGLLRLEQLSAEDQESPRQKEYLRGQIAECVNLVIYITKTPTGRLVKEMVEVNGFNGDSYETLILEDENNVENESYNDVGISGFACTAAA